MPDLKRRQNLSPEHLLASHLLYGLAALDDVHVPISKYIALAYIVQHDGPTITDIAETMELAVSSGTRITRRLEKSGYVHTVSDKKDHRVRHLFLTNDGCALLENFGQQQFKILRRMACANELEFPISTNQNAQTINNQKLASHLLFGLRELSDIHVPVRKYIALAYIAEHEGVSITKLARAMKIAISSGTRIVQRLEESGLTYRTKASQDNRRQEIQLTNKGHLFLERYGAQQLEMISLLIQQGEIPTPGTDVV